MLPDPAVNPGDDILSDDDASDPNFEQRENLSTSEEKLRFGRGTANNIADVII